MSFNAKVKNNQLVTASTGVAGVAGTVVTGTTVLLKNLRAGSTICAEVAMIVKTSSLTMTPSWQVSVDGTTFLDLVPLNSAANVATVGGTGSAVTTTRVIALPGMPLPFKYARIKVLTAGATAVITDDFLATKYHWIEPE